MSEAAQSMEEAFEEPIGEELDGQPTDNDDGLSGEELARSMGWRPQDEFKGPADKWVDAETFLKARNENLAIAKDSNKRLEQIVRDQAKKLKARDAVIDQLKNFNENAYKRALADLKAQQEQAVEEGDSAKFKKLDKEIDELRANAPTKEEKKQADANTQELFTEWLIDNPWYNGDKTKQAYADLQFQKLGGIEGYDGSPEELLEEVTERVNKRFASKEAPQKKVNPVGGANGMRVAPKGSATAASLNAEERHMGQQMVKMGIFSSLDAYAKELRNNG